MMALRFLTVLLSLTLSHTVWAQEQIVGTWMTQTGEAKIGIYPCGAAYCGRIVWLKEPNFPTDSDASIAGKPKTDRNNPDAKLRNEPVVGKEILRNLAYKANGQWSDGEIYDTKSGKTYQCKATLASDGKLQLRGFIGISLLGRTDEWTKVGGS